MDVEQLVTGVEAQERLAELVGSGEARTIREGARLSLGAIGRTLGVSPSTVFRWERGQRLPDLEMARAYLGLLVRLSQRAAS